VIDHWAEVRGWPDMDKPGSTPADVTKRILDLMEERILAEGKAMAGVMPALELCRRMGVKLAVASSSPHRLIEAALKALGIRDAFDVVASAEDEEHGM
jgi:beta-phosphoglucomutase-like phosphatase (HAD superfamily)